MKNLLLLFVLFVSLSACEKETLPFSGEADNLVWIPGVTLPAFDMSSNTHVTIVANGAGWTDADPAIEVYGAVIDGRGNQIDYENLILNGQLLSSEGKEDNGSFYYHFNHLQDESATTFQRLLSSFDNEAPVTINIEGSDAGDFYAELVMPLRLEMSLLNNRSYVENSNTMKTSDGITVTWNAPANPQRNPPDVGIAVVYNPGVSRIDDSNLPSSLPIWMEVTEDDGEFTIPADALDFLPLGAKFTVTVARGAFDQYSYEINGNELIVNGVSYEISKLLEVIE